MSDSNIKFSIGLSNVAPFVNEAALLTPGMGGGGAAGGGGGGGASSGGGGGGGGSGYSSISDGFQGDFTNAIPAYFTVYGAFVAKSGDKYHIVADATEDSYTKDGYAQFNMRICPAVISSNAWEAKTWNTGIAVDRAIFKVFSDKLNNAISTENLTKLYQKHYLYAAIKIENTIVKNLFINDICDEGAMQAQRGTAAYTLDASASLIFAQMGDQFSVNLNQDSASKINGGKLESASIGKTFGKQGTSSDYTGPALYELLKSTATGEGDNWKTDIAKNTLTYNAASFTGKVWPAIFYVLEEDVQEIQTKLDIQVPDCMIGVKSTEVLNNTSASDIQASSDLERINSPITVVLEAGHGAGRASGGGFDSGAANKGRQEHALNARMTEGIAKVLRDMGWNVITLISKPGSTIRKSGSIFNSANAQISASIHNNSAGPTAAGYQFFTRYGCSNATFANNDKMLIDAVTQQVSKMTKYRYTPRGGKAGKWYNNDKGAMVRDKQGNQTNSPSYCRNPNIKSEAHMLIEGCFVSNTTDYDGISNNLDEWCNLVALGIQDYARAKYPQKFGGSAPTPQEANA